MVRKRAATPHFDLSRFSRSRPCPRHLKFIWRELGRLQLERHDLAPYQSEMLRDLADGLDEESLAEMHNYWEYNTEQLFRRRRDRWGAEGIPGKPRIDVVLEMTSKGNFKAEWFPRGWNRWGAPLQDHIGSDFPNWSRYGHRHIGYDSRPSNELFFIRGASHTVDHLRRRLDDRWFVALDPVLLAACSGLVEELKERLQRHFEVRMITDLFLEWRTIEAESKSFFDEADELVSWKIEDPEVVAERNERAELACSAERFGFTADDLMQCWQVEAAKPRCPAPDTNAFRNRIIKALKAQGRNTSPRQVERFLQLLAKYEPTRLSAQAISEMGDVSA